MGSGPERTPRSCRPGRLALRQVPGFLWTPHSSAPARPSLLPLPAGPGLTTPLAPRKSHSASLSLSTQSRGRAGTTCCVWQSAGHFCAVLPCTAQHVVTPTLQRRFGRNQVGGPSSAIIIGRSSSRTRFCSAPKPVFFATPSGFQAGPPLLSIKSGNGSGWPVNLGARPCWEAWLLHPPPLGASHSLCPGSDQLFLGGLEGGFRHTASSPSVGRAPTIDKQAKLRVLKTYKTILGRPHTPPHCCRFQLRDTKRAKILTLSPMMLSQDPGSSSLGWAVCSVRLAEEIHGRIKKTFLLWMEFSSYREAHVG